MRALLCAGALVALLAGCREVKSHEKATLADPVMRLEGDALESAMDRRVLGAREGASGGGAASTGGCGCN